MKYLIPFVCFGLMLFAQSCKAKDSEEKEEETTTKYASQKSIEKVRAINEINDGLYTSEQEEYGLKLYIGFQQEVINELKEQIKNIKEEVAKNMAMQAAGQIYSATSQEGRETESYKSVKDQIVKNNQEIEKLKKELYQSQREILKDFGYPDPY